MPCLSQNVANTVLCKNIIIVQYRLLTANLTHLGLGNFLELLVLLKKKNILESTSFSHILFVIPGFHMKKGRYDTDDKLSQKIFDAAIATMKVFSSSKNCIFHVKTKLGVHREMMQIQQIIDNFVTKYHY